MILLLSRRIGWCYFARVFIAALVVGPVWLGLTTAAALAAWQVNGSAYVPGSNPNVIVVTPLATNQAGSAWLDFPLNLNADFDLTLAVNLGNRDADGADGLSIVLHNDPAGGSAVGDTTAGGEWVGLHGIQNALAVEIDTWQNTTRGDPVCDHIGINEIRDAASLPNHSGAGPQCAESDGSNIEDGADHLVRLVWSGTTRTLRVYWEGVLRFTYTNTNIVSDIFNGADSVWFGVVGSTGGSYNLQQFRSVVDSSQLTVTKSVSPTSIDPGDPLTYSILLQNNSAVTTFVTQIEDQLPAGFSYRVGTSTGLTTFDPIVAGQVLTWNGAWILDPGDSVTLSFQSQGSAMPGAYFNTVVVRGSNFFDVSSGATAAVIVGSDLSTSTKTVLDLNGGNAEPGDTLRYIITLMETAGQSATMVSVTDDIPAAVTGFTVIAIPAGSVNNSTGDGTGANGTGHLEVTSITVPAGGSAVVVFEVPIHPGAGDGTTIDNTATISNPSGSGAAPASSTVTVIDPAVPASGNKRLYFYTDQNGPVGLSRTPTSDNQYWREVTIDGRDEESWLLIEPLVKELTISGTVNVDLWIRGGSNRRVSLELRSSTEGQLGTSAQFIPPDNYGNSPSRYQITINGGIRTVPNNSYLELIIRNESSRSSRDIDVEAYYDDIPSIVILNALTVINVDSTAFYSDNYSAGGAILTSAAPGQTVYVRATVSDPFGSFDIQSASIELIDPLGGSQTYAMDEVDADAATKTYQYEFPIPLSGLQGIWTARVTAEEGTEDEVRHTRQATLQVSLVDILLLKTVSVISDPVNGTNNAKAIPGAMMQYTIIATNQGGGATDSNSVVVIDPVPADTALFVGDLGTPGSGPVAFINGSISSGLTYTFGGLGSGTDEVDFSNNNGGNWSYTPVPDGNGVDAAVTDIRINPKGIFNGAFGGSIPSFTLHLRVRVK